MTLLNNIEEAVGNEYFNCQSYQNLTYKIELDETTQAITNKIISFKDDFFLGNAGINILNNLNV